MSYTFVRDKEHARLMEVEQLLRLFCRQNKGMVWLSSRQLVGKKLFRGATSTMERARQLADMGYLGRATARGRGRGRGRTLYWLPAVKKWQVLQELKREDMPHSAIVQALGFYLRRERSASEKNVTDGLRQQSLGLSTVGTEAEKGTPAEPAQRSRAPSGPPGQPRKPRPITSTPPSLGRLTRHGWEPAPVNAAVKIAALLDRRASPYGRFTDDPATHPASCECSEHLARGT